MSRGKGLRLISALLDLPWVPLRLLVIMLALAAWTVVLVQATGVL